VFRIFYFSVIISKLNLFHHHCCESHQVYPSITTCSHLVTSHINASVRLVSLFGVVVSPCTFYQWHRVISSSHWKCLVHHDQARVQGLVSVSHLITSYHIVTYLTHIAAALPPLRVRVVRVPIVYFSVISSSTCLEKSIKSISVSSLTSSHHITLHYHVIP
jgi:hypothetical protein